MRKGFRQDDYEQMRLDTDKQKEKTPMVLIVFQGGLGTLRSVLESLNNEIPVLLIAVSDFFK